MERELVQFKEKILSEIQTLNNQPTLSPSELCNGKEAVEVLNAIQKYNLMTGGNEDGENEYYEDDGNSLRRGRNSNTGRHMSMDRRGSNMGRSNGSYNSYDSSPMNGRSGHSIKDRAKALLEGMYDETDSPHEHQMIDQMIEKVERA